MPPFTINFYRKDTKWINKFISFFRPVVLYTVDYRYLEIVGPVEITVSRDISVSSYQ